MFILYLIVIIAGLAWAYSGFRMLGTHTLLGKSRAAIKHKKLHEQKAIELDREELKLEVRAEIRAEVIAMITSEIREEIRADVEAEIREQIRVENIKEAMRKANEKLETNAAQENFNEKREASVKHNRERAAMLKRKHGS